MKGLFSDNLILISGLAAFLLLLGLGCPQQGSCSQPTFVSERQNARKYVDCAKNAMSLHYEDTTALNTNKPHVIIISLGLFSLYNLSMTPAKVTISPIVWCPETDTAKVVRSETYRITHSYKEGGRLFVICEGGSISTYEIGDEADFQQIVQSLLSCSNFFVKMDQIGINSFKPKEPIRITGPANAPDIFSIDVSKKKPTRDKRGAKK